MTTREKTLVFATLLVGLVNNVVLLVHAIAAARGR